MKTKKIFKNILTKIVCFSFLVLPTSTNYGLDGFSFGNGGGEANLSSSSYEMSASVGDINSDKLSSTNYDLSAGLAFTLQSNVPTIAVFDNPNNYYNKLHFALDTQHNADDTKYAIAISSDNFITTQYVKSDNSIGSSLALTDYQTYNQWGNTAGTLIVGLKANTTYKIKAKAMQGKFTETDFGPSSTASTSPPHLSYDIDTAPTDIETNPPYVIDFGELQPSVVGTAVNKIWVDLDTNASSGANVFIYSQNSGLYSLNTSFKINALSGNLDIATSGFGTRNNSVTQTAGAIIAVPPYDGINNVVGIVDNSIRNILSSRSTDRRKSIFCFEG